MKFLRPVAIVILILFLSASSLLAKKDRNKKVKHDGEEWIKVSLERLYQTPKEFANRRICFEIETIGVGKIYDYETTPGGKQYLKFYTRTDDGHRVYLWVRKTDKDILESFYDFEDDEDEVRVFARTKRKSSGTHYWDNKTRFFVIVKDVLTLD